MTILDRINTKDIILASGSPRRKELLEQLDLRFRVERIDVDETYPGELRAGAIAAFLSRKKSDAFGDLQENQILITADTIVWHGNQVLHKPKNHEEAVSMIGSLSGQRHEVYTGYTIRTHDQFQTSNKCTTVVFRNLSREQIEYYVAQYSPFDKAGSYGIQDWIGYVGVEEIHGCYYNVMGLPVSDVYNVLESLV